MRVLVLGGDGYLGWPTAMSLSAHGHEVAVADNYLRRQLVTQSGSDSLTPILNLPQRAAAWQEVSGRTIDVHLFDLCDYDLLNRIVRDFHPDAIVHYGQIPSAPYSMQGRSQATFTQMNNIENNLNVIFAILENNPDCHLVKLGTMGEYGCPNIDIEEGYLEIEHKGRTDTLPFPKMPRSCTTPARSPTPPTSTSPAGSTVSARPTSTRASSTASTARRRCSTTGCSPGSTTTSSFGTALNRFCLQAVVGRPLTVYGSGGQTRGFLNLRDTLACVELAVLNPADRGEMRVYNQFTESFSIRELAAAVQAAGKELGLDVEIGEVENPRSEAQEHYYNPTHTKLLDLGLQPTLLSEDLVTDTLSTLMKYQDRTVHEAIAPRTTWR